MSRVVIVPCSAAKRDRPAPAGAMYLSQYHRACRAAADALVTAAGGGRVLILSAEYGLLELGDLITPYDRKMGDPGSVSVDTLRTQAARLGVLDATDVVALGGKKYVDAVAAVRPDVLRPLDGTRGIGDHLRRLDQIARGEYEVAAAGEPVAEVAAPRRRPGRPPREGGPKPKRSVRVGDVWEQAQRKAEREGVPFADVVERLLASWVDPALAAAAPAAQLPRALPACGATSTVRIEAYSPRDGRAHGSLDAAARTCDEHAQGVTEALRAGGFIPYRCSVTGLEEQWTCGEGVDYRNPQRAHFWRDGRPLA